MQLIPELDYLDNDQLGQKVPWNRRIRRRLESAKHLVLHLYAGKDMKCWTDYLGDDGTEILCVDILDKFKANMLDDATFTYILKLVMTGRVKAIIGGPPCRTVSALRYQEDDGPRAVRDKASPYGLEQRLVDQDSLLWMRMLALYVLAEEVRDPTTSQPTAFMVEQPEDPKNYRDPVEVMEKGFMSMWRTQEWLQFEKEYNMVRISFDQGCMGHQKKKPTTIGTNIPGLMELAEMRGGGVDQCLSVTPSSRKARTVQERCAESKQWAEWAPGFKKVLMVVLRQWLNQDLGSPRGQLKKLKPLTLEQWKSHFAHDHLPARRDCRHCVQAQARSRPHHRVRHPESFTLSVDLSGKMSPGGDQCTKGTKQVSYLMVASYTFPTTKSGKPLVKPPTEEEPVDQPLPPLDADLDGEGAPGVPPASAEDPALAAREGRDRSSDDAEVDPLHEEEPVVEKLAAMVEESAQQAYATWHKLIDEATDIQIQNLTFVEVVPSRAAQDVLPALARIYCRLRSLNLPLYRVHTDRAREFLAAPIRRWLLDRGVISTLTPGSSWKSNGRAEAEIGVIKRGIRTLINAEKCTLTQWPLAARHVAERRLRDQLHRLGWPAGPLLAFGTRGYAIRKWWQSRYEDWCDVREPVILMGPDASSSMTHTAYYVQSTETGNFFYTDDVLTVDPRTVHGGDLYDGADDDTELVPYLPVRGDTAAPPVWPDQPRRRIRGKSTVPDFAMHRIAGEDDDGFLLVDAGSVLDSDDGEAGSRNSVGVEDSWVDATAWDIVDDLDALSMVDDSHSWTLETAPSSSTTSLRSLVEDDACGGEQEGVPNNRAGGSHPMTPNQKTKKVQALRLQVQALQFQQANLHHLIEQELQRIDGTQAEQGWCLPVVSEQMKLKQDIEDRLLRQMRATQDKVEKDLETEFLVTKTISNKEVWSYIEDWRESIVKEYDQLVNQKKAVTQMSRQDLNQLAQRRGLPIELLPGKTVHTRKSGTGQYKTRAVACGNYAEVDNTDHYAGGCDGVQVRALIRHSAIKEWKVGATDIRTAFLNAPKRNQTRLTALEIPAIMKQCGLAEPGEVWLIEKALYGLTTSPKDWCLYRDEELPKITWSRIVGVEKWHGRFVKTKDENLWSLQEVKEGTEEVHQRGMMSIYVDDLLLAGEEMVVQHAFEAVTKKWSTTPIEWASVEKPVKYCGFEIYTHPSNDGYLVNQSMYEAEMLAKWEVDSTLESPVFRINEDDFVQSDEVDAGSVKRAQAMAGSLLWLATRTRPDLSFGVMTLCQLCTRNPKKALEVGDALLRYVKGNAWSLHYSKEVLGGAWGSRDQLKVARDVNTLEVYSDIAFATSAGHKSVQGIIIYLAGAPIAWQSNRQPFCCHSTAEAELVSLCEALLVGKSTEALLLCMLEFPDGGGLRKILYGDNMASISLGNGTSMSWRTRHLRIRSSVLKEATNEDLPVAERWELLHLKGSELVSDGLTKPFLGHVFRRFLEDLGMTSPRPRSDDRGAVCHGDQPRIDPTQLNRILALVIASLMIRETTAAPVDDDDSGRMVFYGGMMFAMIGCGTVMWLLGRCFVWWMKLIMGRHGPAGSSDDGAISLKSRKPSGSSDDGTTSLKSRKPSGSSDDGTMSLRSGKPSGSLDDEATSWKRVTQSGLMSSSAASSSRMRPQSGMECATTLKPTRRSCTSGGGDGADRTAMARDSVSSLCEEKSMKITDTLGSQSTEVVAITADSEGVNIRNPWNRFQHQNRRRGWTIEEMSKRYHLQKKK
eukprot:Skav217693  [mRNA]  locus=scaffold1925:59391:64646:+ [translate_table: standard]